MIKIDISKLAEEGEKNLQEWIKNNQKEIECPFCGHNYLSFYCVCPRCKVLNIQEDKKIISKNELKNIISEEVVVPPWVKKIDDFAFQDCKKLKTVYIPEMVDSMGSHVFSGCNGLEKIVIANGGVNCASSAFCGFLSNVEVYVPKGSIDSFENQCGKWLINYVEWEYGKNWHEDNEELLDEVFPIWAKTVWQGAFRYSGLNSIKLHQYVSSIESGAFWKCEKLTEIDIPKGLERIGCGAFYGCNGLKKLTIPNSVKEIGNWAFRDCKNIETIDIQGPIEKMGSYVFTGCNKVKCITVPKGYEKTIKKELPPFLRWRVKAS